MGGRSGQICHWLRELDERHDIDPTEFRGSTLQFAACPGPDELDNLIYLAGDENADLVERQENMEEMF